MVARTVAALGDILVYVEPCHLLHFANIRVHVLRAFWCGVEGTLGTVDHYPSAGGSESVTYIGTVREGIDVYDPVLRTLGDTVACIVEIGSNS